MDWMSEAQIQQEWQVFCRKLHPTRGRVLWRSFAHQQHITALKLLDFHPDAVIATEAAHAERVGMYNSTHLATLPPGFLVCAPPTAAAATAAPPPPPSAQVGSGIPQP